MARVKGNLKRGLSASRDFVADPVTPTSQVDPRVQQARSQATRGRGTVAPSLAAAAGAGFVFGPVGALLAGWAVNQSQRNDNKRRAAAAAALANNRVESLDKARSSLQGALADAETDQDRAELKATLDSFDAYATAAFSPDPATAGAAFQKALDVSGTLQQQLDDQQNEQIEREKLLYEKTQTWETQATAMRNKLAGESKAYIDANRQFRNLQSLLDKDDISKVDATTAIFSYAKLVNPGEITTDGDVQVLSAGGNLSSQMAARLNSIILGNAYMDERVAAEMLESAKTLMRTQRQEQIERNAGAQAFAKDLGIPNDIRRNISIPVSGDASDLVPRPLPPDPNQADPNGTTTPAKQVVDAVVGPFLPEGGLEEPQPIFDRWREGITDWYSGSGREERQRRDAERRRNRKPLWNGQND